MNQVKKKKNSFQCNHCYKKFISKDTYSKHLTYHLKHNTQTYTCRRCSNMKFNSFTEFINHKKTLHSYKCEACLKVFLKPSVLKLHIRSVHLNNNATPHLVNTKKLHDRWEKKVGNLNVTFTKVSLNKIIIKCKLDKPEMDTNVVKDSVKKTVKRRRANIDKAIASECPKDDVELPCITRAARKSLTKFSEKKENIDREITRAKRKSAPKFSEKRDVENDCQTNTDSNIDSNKVEIKTELIIPEVTPTAKKPKICWIIISEDGWSFDCYGHTNQDCCMNAKSKLSLKNHIRRDHMKLDIRCQTCRKTFLKRKQFGRHQCVKPSNGFE